MRSGKPLIESGWTRALWLFIFIVGIHTGGLYLFSSGTDNPENNITAISIPFYGKLSGTEVMVLLSSVLSIITVIIFCNWINKVSFRSLGFSLNNRQSFAGILMPPALLGTGTMVLYWTGHLSWTGWDLNLQHLAGAVLFLFVVSFSEEVIFRGYILQNLLQSLNRWIAVLISSLVFAAVHAGNPEMNVVAFANLFAAGLLLSACYLYTGNLWCPIFFHFCWNFFQGPVLGFPVSGLNMESVIQTSLTGDQLITGGLFGFEGSVISLALILVTFMMLFWKLQSGSLLRKV